MDCSELQKSVSRQPSLRNLTQADYGKPKPQQNKVRTFVLNLRQDTSKFHPSNQVYFRQQSP